MGGVFYQTLCMGHPMPGCHLTQFLKQQQVLSGIAQFLHVALQFILKIYTNSCSLKSSLSYYINDSQKEC